MARRHVISSILFWLVLVAVGAFVGFRMFPSDENRIRGRLDGLAADAGKVSADVAGLAVAARIGTYFTEDVVIEPGQGLDPLRGRDTIMGLATRMRGNATDVRVSVADARIVVADSRRTADVDVTVSIRRAVPGSGESLDAREFSLVMVKNDDVWQISRVTSIDTLRHP